jgi:hypothetical protein
MASSEAPAPGRRRDHVREDDDITQRQDKCLNAPIVVSYGIGDAVEFVRPLGKIAAIRFKGDRRISTFESLVNPKRPFRSCFSGK